MGKYVRVTHTHPMAMQRIVNQRVGKKAVITFVEKHNHYVVRCGTLQCVIDGEFAHSKKDWKGWTPVFPVLDDLRKRVGRQYD